MLRRFCCLCAILLTSHAACGDDAGSGGSAQAGGGAKGGGEAAGGAGGAGGVEPCFEPPLDASAPTPTDVDFVQGAPLLEGEQILFNDWSPQPNELLTMRPDGADETVILQAYRVWSFGVSGSLQKIAFAAGDPDQVANYGVTLGDAIQPTFVYDLECGTVGALTWGNLNDECHTFGADDRYVYLCRRSDFDDMGGSAYRLGRVEVATGTFEWLSPEEAATHRLSPQPTADQTELFLYRILVPGGGAIVRAPVLGGAEIVVRDRAGYPRLSPDGSRLLAADFDQGGALVSLDTAGGAPVLVAAGESLTTAVWSPDGSRVAFLRWDDVGSCSHVETAAADGSEAQATTRIHDCVASGRFVTELSWVAK